MRLWRVTLDAPFLFNGISAVSRRILNVIGKRFGSAASFLLLCV